MKHQLLVSLVVGLLLLVTLASSSTGFAEPPSPPDVEQLRVDAGGAIEITWNPQTNTPSFVGGSIPLGVVGLSQKEKSDPEAAAFAILDRYAAIFGMTAPVQELQVEAAEVDEIGMTHVTLQQVYQGVVVYNATVKVHLSADGQTVAAIGNQYVPGIQLTSVQPTTAAEDALTAARLALPRGEMMSEPELVVYAQVAENPGASARLAWLVELRDDSVPVRNVYVVDATKGGILHVIERLYEQEGDNMGEPSSEEGANVKPSGPSDRQCEPKIYYGVEHCSDSSGRADTIIVNLRDPHVRLQTVLSSRNGVECNSVNHSGKDSSSNCAPPYPVETMESMLRRYISTGGAAIINTDYGAYPVGDHGAQGLTVRNGVRLDGPQHGVTNDLAYNQPSLAISPSNVAVISIPGSQEVINNNLSGTYFNTVGGAPIIVQGGQPANDSCTFPYPGDTCSRESQSAAGLTNDGRLILITARKDAPSVSRYLLDYYQVQTALKFDGGGSARMAWLDSSGNIQQYSGTSENRAVYEGLLVISSRISASDCPDGQYRAEYFNNRTLSGNPALTRCEPAPIAKDWGNGRPVDGVNPDDFSVRWTGRFNFTVDTFTFLTEADDGISLWINGSRLIYNWQDQSPTIRRERIAIGGGQQEIRVEYYEHSGGATAHVRWWGDSTDTDDGRDIHGGETLWGAISPNADVDTYYFDGVANQRATISLNKRFLQALDPFLRLYAPNGQEVEWDDDDGPENNALLSDVTLSQAGRYRIEARSYQGNSNGPYALQLRLRTPGQVDRETYNANHTTSLPGTLARLEVQGPVGDSDVDNAHSFAGDTYNYYWQTHQRDSFDNRGAKLISTAHYGRNYQNAFWNGTQMVYGDGFPVKDVIAHELTHAVTERTANLEYEWQSGALNESFSDIFGVMVDRDDWLMGEDLPEDALGGREAIRDLANPKRFGQPDHVRDWNTDCSDHQGVHTNSGILNKAFYNIATHAAVGKDKAERIFFRTLTRYLQANSSLEDARAKAIQSATDLYANETAVINAVRDGFNAVGLDGQWNPPSNSCGCAATVALDDAAVYPDRSSALETAATLYRVRDRMLDPSPTGRYYRSLYEQYTGRASYLMLIDPSLRAQGGGVLSEFTPSLAQWVDSNGEQVVLSQAMVTHLESFLQNLAQADRASGKGNLAAVIAQEMVRVNLAHLAGMTFAQAWEEIGSARAGRTIYLPTILR